MSLIFSKRCKSGLKAGKIKVKIPIAVRNRIWMLLQEFSETWYETTETGWNYNVNSMEDVTYRLKSEHGFEELKTYTKDKERKIVSGDLESFLLRGTSPPLVFDVLELYYNTTPKDKKTVFQSKINDIFTESDLPWRMAEGEIFPVDSIYVEENILRQSQELLKNVKFYGVLEEFQKARTDLINGDYQGAIQNANLAVESTIKSILGIDKAKPGELFRKLIDSELIPEYYNGFLSAFEENILRCVAIMRNEEKGAGHGQGSEINIIPEELAELGVHLSGVLIHFLVKRHISTLAAPEKEEEPDTSDDLPF